MENRKSEAEFWSGPPPANPFEQLPPDIVVSILTFLEPRDLAAVSKTSRLFLECGWRNEVIWRNYGRNNGVSPPEGDKSWRQAVEEVLSFHFIPDPPDPENPRLILPHRVEFLSKICTTCLLTPPVTHGIKRVTFAFDDFPDFSNIAVGWSSTTNVPNDYLGNSAASVDWNCSGGLFGAHSPEWEQEAGCQHWGAHDQIGIELNMDRHTVRLFKNGTFVCRCGIPEQWTQVWFGACGRASDQCHHTLVCNLVRVESIPPSAEPELKKK
ncbi:hypothetical protein PAPYR_12822 [Paratrimastix pyriformis]|uniref:F-box domain-containing protein n=1 Tax=Paratrimastix pyriformis TaxID=342808 RepID=A0ABQ8U189_9EUKA|nr:hypothetical protein PAPYR_12822 [Paratrimastix pyriformis]